ncbi:dolichyl-P-Man:Man(7)GlcNAc(2)-PP-dolichol alpha-1,6-mannosyltransferase [Phytophthora pseudosyringae]|uniref:Mannosyltransferase n=1 Tax=Phytophthora pseudosyringae TaxID=221518 RepID=A0A8T1VR10_9STRA|nr:dolichyl-P-Man:Man(7)GlcNAc(2)-PP-dolichol alpha-1,6-mannosyltransferase [Phytophthora pseudosyringae]
MALLMRGRRAELLAAGAMTAHLLLCPFAKVEESFNLQATHDLLAFGARDVAAFDHLTFPGVVPRTFVGSLAVAGVSRPVVRVLLALGVHKLWLQVVTRWVLGMLTLGGLVFFGDGVGMRFGRDVSRFLLLISACQFHLLFYMTRTLPNVYALALVLFALGFGLRGKWQRCVFLFTFATVVFRADTVVLFAPLVLNMLLSRRVSFFQMVWWGLSAGAVSLLVTVVVDSHFWQRWLWPEGEVLWFNTVQNKSSEWGVSPPLWYFTSALPRALQMTALLIPLGLSTLLPTLLKSRSLHDVAWSFKTAPILDWSVVSLVWPVFVYLGLYSFLPHKELRFIFNAIPILNMVSAVGLAKLYRNRHKARLPFAGAVGCLLVTILGTLFLLTAARSNYPGGEAFVRLHQLAANEHNLPRSVHIDVPAAMTGVSRFGEEFPAWSYSKDESLTTLEQLTQFDYLLTAQDPTPLEDDFQYIAGFDAFAGIGLVDHRITLKTKKLVFLMRNRKITPGHA